MAAGVSRIAAIFGSPDEPNSSRHPLIQPADAPAPPAKGRLPGGGRSIRYEINLPASDIPLPAKPRFTESPTP